ncbi:dehydrogenase [Bacillus sp. HMF5848]|uniref:TorD/DmsD family molecular chaperone n=1 Tax=Bacillus sp. HMF5848 TaxID=2495421 RepID=UPI000F76A591|nr:molecular chaperone TorD family protein [Bacillus sp. HMF5848]RSK26202.1 dehydrogenase [Bacillus sp. HMF5848]
MIAQKAETLLAYEELLYVIAEFFKPPIYKFYKELDYEGIERLLKSIGYDEQVTWPKPSSYEDLQYMYMRCFVGPDHLTSPPVESLYKRWTTDSTAQVSFASEAGYLYGDSALHMEHLYEVNGLEIPAFYSRIPDHLTLLLEFAAYLIELDQYSALKNFIHEHLDWLPALRTQLAAIKDSHFYVCIINILIDVLTLLENEVEGRE